MAGTTTDSRVKEGTLVFGGVVAPLDASCAVTKLAIVPSVTDEDSVTTLCGNVLGGGSKTEDRLQFDVIADFDGPALRSFVQYSWLHRGATVPVDITFNASGEHWTGTVLMEAAELGGEIDAQTTISMDLQLLTLNPPASGTFGDGSLHPGVLSKPIAITGISSSPVGSVYSFEPKGANPIPGTLSALKGDSVVGDGGSAKPSGVWAQGSYLLLSDGVTKVHWDNSGTTWATGAAS